jgi:hypothetical protein
MTPNLLKEMVTEKMIEDALGITLSSVNLPASECLHESDVRELLEAALSTDAEPVAWRGVNLPPAEPQITPSRAMEIVLASIPMHKSYASVMRQLLEIQRDAERRGVSHVPPSWRE